MIFQVCNYKNKIAIFDSVCCVYYFGFKTKEEAQKRCDQFNKMLV